ncbi:acyl-coenzyme A thioesterase THEM4-like isoform X2 [Varanus komodoensis]|uniref:acyl-coenzyme A thioesterase THEM4-like isoform X2 n=1 Tax=Varanus komodoensis TaxID=61221 RepID=UPI001CF7BBB9|nr:acyl-coenzyme A thioesterase THEM4-like isoform X2 [Varanus komodoensis]
MWYRIAVTLETVLPVQETKDFCLPSLSWSQEMLKQFARFMEMSKDGTWRRIPNSRHFHNDVPEWVRKESVAKNPDGTRMFLRNMDTEGVGFEYALFFNGSEKRMVSIFQPGRYLEGAPGLVPGGAIAAMLDNNLGACAIGSVGLIVTANLNIDHLSIQSPS